MISTRIAILPPASRWQRYQGSDGRRDDIVGVTKVIEVIGSSSESSDDAVREALSAASRSIRGITRIEVTSISCEVKDGHIARWDVLAKMQFPVEPR
jgi:flavin-binding protein dodecin